MWTNLAWSSLVKTYNIHYAKTHLSQLIEDAVAGRPFVIAKAGRPLVKVVPLKAQEHEVKRIGFLEGAYPPMTLQEFNDVSAEEIEKMSEGGV